MSERDEIEHEKVERASGFTIAHRDELERTGGWSLARRTLGCTSFGINLVEIEPNAQIPEHDEIARDQEEVFLVLDGDATIVIDGTDHVAPAGTFVRLDPEPVRTVRNDGSDRATVLIVSAPRTSGYEPMDWA
jgi:quercetin dioxygenase-like cupin family protein